MQILSPLMSPTVAVSIVIPLKNHIDARACAQNVNEEIVSCKFSRWRVVTILHTHSGCN